jgi:hypothetical protein
VSAARGGKVLLEKYRPAGILLTGNVVIYCKFKFLFELRANKN